MSIKQVRWVGSIRLTSVLIAMILCLSILDGISYIYMNLLYEEYEINTISEQIISNTIGISYLAIFPIICGFVYSGLRMMVPMLGVSPVVGMVILSGLAAFLLKPVLLPIPNLSSAVVALMIVVIAAVLGSTSAVVERARSRRKSDLEPPKAI